jgi:hypothetical protein
MKLQRQWFGYCVNAVERRRSPWSCAGLRLFSTPSPYQSLDVLQNASINIFREKYFRPEYPAILPRACFRVLPACDRWFTKPSSPGSSPTLNYNYLEQHADTSVPLELTHSSPPLQKLDGDSGQSAATDAIFQRFHAPLSLFLDWTRSAPTQSVHLYLAQCQVSDLPAALRDDFPTPDLVSQTGRGDIYDTNIWMGIPPTYTPLHRDPNPNLFVQLAGRKEVRLLSPDIGMRVFSRVRMDLGQSAGQGAAAFRSDEMMQGHERLLLEEAVWGNDLLGSPALLPQEVGYHVVLEAGDGLFIPKGWWHSIKGVGDGITASVRLI